MYIPLINKFENTNEIISFMREFPFANLISQIDKKPFATSIPFLIEKLNVSEIKLVAHCARENIHWKHIDNQTNLVIFQEPHAFISTELYERDSVPTWNYLSVHAYGKATLITDITLCKRIIDNTISLFQKSFQKDWLTYSESKIKKLLNGIVCFEINIDNLEAKAKLSQNKTKKERKNIYTHLMRQSSNLESTIGQEMLKRESKKDE